MSAEEKAARRAALHKSKELDNKMSKDHSADEEVNKLLLLGAGESGKSTLFKQMIQIYGKGFPEMERKTFISVIHNNIISSMKTLCQQSTVYGPVESSGAQEAKRYVDSELKGDEEIDEKLGQILATLWADRGIQKTYEMRSRYQLTDSAKYFFDKLDEVRFSLSLCVCLRVSLSDPLCAQVSKKSYIPNEQDILRCRVRTTGILENEFSIDGNQFKMFDVGGQRNERKKWIHWSARVFLCFTVFSACFYVFSFVFSLCFPSI